MLLTDGGLYALVWVSRLAAGCLTIPWFLRQAGFS